MKEIITIHPAMTGCRSSGPSLIILNSSGFPQLGELVIIFKILLYSFISSSGDIELISFGFVNFTIQKLNLCKKKV